MTEPSSAEGLRSIAGGEEVAATPGATQQPLAACVGRWINLGETVATPEAPGVSITTSDVYEWAPGGFFILHTAYGKMGDDDVGAIELIGYDPATETYRTHLFDSQGNVAGEELTIKGRVWTYRGESTRARAEFSEDGEVQVVQHERSDDGGASWVPVMEVTLRRVG